MGFGAKHQQATGPTSDGDRANRRPG